MFFPVFSWSSQWLAYHFVRAGHICAVSLTVQAIVLWPQGIIWYIIENCKQNVSNGKKVITEIEQIYHGVNVLLSFSLTLTLWIFKTALFQAFLTLAELTKSESIFSTWVWNHVGVSGWWVQCLVLPMRWKTEVLMHMLRNSQQGRKNIYLAKILPTFEMNQAG